MSDLLLTNQRNVGYYKDNKTLGGEVMARRYMLIALRKERKWSQKDVVDELRSLYGYDISVSYYGMIEQGVRTPKLELALAIADLFEKTAEEIFFSHLPNETLCKEQSATSA
jgi:putative transcriptional regulator